MFMTFFLLFCCRFSVRKQIYNYIHKCTCEKPSRINVLNAPKHSPIVPTCLNTPESIWVSLIHILNKLEFIVSQPTSASTSRLQLVQDSIKLCNKIVVCNYSEEYEFSVLLGIKKNKAKLRTRKIQSIILFLYFKSN